MSVALIISSAAFIVLDLDIYGSVAVTVKPLNVVVTTLPVCAVTLTGLDSSSNSVVFHCVGEAFAAS